MARRKDSPRALPRSATPTSTDPELVPPFNVSAAPLIPLDVSKARLTRTLQRGQSPGFVPTETHPLAGDLRLVSVPRAIMGGIGQSSINISRPETPPLQGTERFVERIIEGSPERQRANIRRKRRTTK
ncbi:MAG: hypothetical protein V3S43_06245 [Acidimicrobiia bacterium]